MLRVSAFFLLLLLAGMPGYAQKSYDVREELRDKRKQLTALAQLQQKTIDSLKAARKDEEARILAGLGDYYAKLEERTKQDSIRKFMDLNYPSLLAYHKKIENSDGLIFGKREQIVVTRHERIDEYNHRFYLTGGEDSRQDWFKDTDLVSGDLLSFVQKRKYALNGLMDYLNDDLPVNMDILYSDSIRKVQ